MLFEQFAFGSIRVDGTTYDHDLVIDRGRVRKLVIDDPNGYRVAGQTVSRVVPGAGEVDPSVAVDPADVLA